MSEASFDLKTAAAELFGIKLTPEQLGLFEAYLSELTDWNTRMNLTSITEPDAVRVKHFLDSLSVARSGLLKPQARVIDIGSGAGLPGLALHLACPGLHTVLLEATGKKITFLDHVIQTLGLSNIRTLHARAEDAGHISHHRAHYDLVLARAVARLPVLVEYLLPFARVGGHCVAMKGATAHDEVKDAETALRLLGGQVVSVEQIVLPGVEDQRYLIVIEKLKSTPGMYPRKAGTPSKSPLGAS